MESRTSPRFVVQVGEATMTAESDDHLCFLQDGVKIHRKTIALVIEVCFQTLSARMILTQTSVQAQDPQQKNFPEILAQEVSGMVALAQQSKDRKAKEVYKVRASKRFC